MENEDDNSQVIINPGIENDTGGYGWVVVEGVEYPIPPDGIKVMSHGGGYDEIAKRIVYGPGTFGKNTVAYNKDNAKAMQRLSARARQQRLIDATDNALSTRALDGIADTGLEMILGQQIDNALGTGRDSTAAARFVLQAGGYMVAPGQGSGEDSGQTKYTLPSLEYLDKVAALLGQVARLQGSGEDGEDGENR